MPCPTNIRTDQGDQHDTAYFCTLFTVSFSTLAWTTSVPQMPNKLSDFLSFFSAPTPFETGRVCYFCLKLPFFTTRCCGFSGANCMKPVLPHVRLPPPPLDLILLFHEQYGTDIGLHLAEVPLASRMPDCHKSQTEKNSKSTQRTETPSSSS